MIPLNYATDVYRTKGHCVIVVVKILFVSQCLKIGHEQETSKYKWPILFSPI